MRSKTLTGFRALLFHAVPWVRLKLPILMDTNLHVCGREANQNSFTMLGLKRRLEVLFEAQNGLRSHLKASNEKYFPGDHFPRPFHFTLCVYYPWCEVLVS